MAAINWERVWQPWNCMVSLFIFVFLKLKSACVCNLFYMYVICSTCMYKAKHTSYFKYKLINLQGFIYIYVFCICKRRFPFGFCFNIWWYNVLQFKKLTWCNCSENTSVASSPYKITPEDGKKIVEAVSTSQWK